MMFCFVPDSIAQKAHCQSHDPRQSPVLRKIGIWWTGDRDELSPRFEHSERFFERLCAQTIQNHIVIMQDFFEIVFPVIDDNICTQALHPLEIRRARCRRDDRTKMLRQLNGNGSYTTGACMDEHFLPCRKLRSFDQHLPGGQADQRDGSRFFHGEVFWLLRHGIFLDRNAFRERPDAIVVWPRIDLVAWLESLHSRSDSDDDPSHLIAQNEWEAIRQKAFELSVSDFGIQQVDTSGVDLDQDVILPQLRLWHVASPHAILASITIDDEGLHHMFFLLSDLQALPLMGLALRLSGAAASSE